MPSSRVLTVIATPCRSSSSSREHSCIDTEALSRTALNQIVPSCRAAAALNQILLLLLVLLLQVR